MLRKKNYAKLIGKIIEPIELSHEILGEKIYVTTLEVKRKSGNIDKVPLRIPERVFNYEKIKQGTQVFVEGECRSVNKDIDNKRSLIVDIFVHKILKVSVDLEHVNEITLTGYICKKPIFRSTPLGREIVDFMIAINMPFGKSYYIPCIAWEKEANVIKELNVGTKITLTGRFQSRNYLKEINNEVLNKTALEISICTYLIKEK